MQYKNGDAAADIVGNAMMIEVNEVMVPAGDDNPIPVTGSFEVTGGATLAEQEVQTTHLAAIETAVESIDTKTPALGQALAASSVPVVLTAAQITTLTPVAGLTDAQLRATPVPVSGTVAVTGVATAANQATEITALGDIETAVDGIETLLGSQATATKQDSLLAELQLKANLDETQPVSMATNTPVGNVAHDAADSGSPIKTGGRARTSEIAAVANDDRTDSIHDKTGRQVVAPHALPEQYVSGAITSAMTGTTSTSLVAAPAGSLRNYITTIIVSNAHATVGTDVVIQDGNGGTTLLTIPAAAVYGGAVINLPFPLRQPTAATALYCANVTTGASTKVSAVGFTGL